MHPLPIWTHSTMRHDHPHRMTYINLVEQMLGPEQGRKDALVRRQFQRILMPYHADRPKWLTAHHLI